MALYINGIKVLGGSTASGTFGALTVTNDGTKTTLSTLAGDYFRIGDAATTSHSLNSEDDLLVTGDIEVDGTASLDGTVNFYGEAAMRSILRVRTDINCYFGTSSESIISFQDADADAKSLRFIVPNGSGTLSSIIPVGDGSIDDLDIGLFDGVTQPGLAAIEKDAKVAGISNASSSGVSTTLTTATGSTFDNVVVGDIVRVTAGTNATVGWYFVDAVTDGTNIVLDRNWCTDAVTSDGVIVLYHDFPMLSADGICTRITDGAPSDSSVEIDRDGWIIIDARNRQPYWRASSQWVTNPVVLRMASAQIMEILGDVSGFWPMADITGTTITDYSANGQDGTASKDIATWDTPPAVQGSVYVYDFDGVDEEFDVTDNALFSTAGAFSVGAWVNMTAGTDSTIIAVWDVDNTLREFRLYLDDNGYPSFECYDESGDDTIGREDQTAIGTGSWKFVVGVMDGGTDAANLKIYVNGIQTDDANIVDDAAFADIEDTGAALMVGHIISSGVAELHDGAMWGPFYTPKELSADEIWNLYQIGRGLLNV